MSMTNPSHNPNPNPNPVPEPNPSPINPNPSSPNPSNPSPDRPWPSLVTLALIGLDPSPSKRPWESALAALRCSRSPGPCVWELLLGSAPYSACVSVRSRVGLVNKRII